MSDAIDLHCEHETQLGVDALTPHPKNPNTHSTEQIERLSELIRYQGFRHPIIVSKRSGFIVAGHGRLAAAKLLGMNEVPVDYQDFESDEQEYAFLVSDNAIAEWAMLDMGAINLALPELGPDFDVAMLGLKDFTIDVAEKNNEDPDAVPATPPEAKTKRGELWILGEHRLLCGDSTDRDDVARLMAGERADLLYTDPPYGDASLLAENNVFRFSEGQNNVARAKKYQKYEGDGSFQFKDFFQHVEGLADHLIVWGGNCFTDSLPVSRCWIVWDKAANEDATGNWFSDCELAWTNLKMPIIKIRHVLHGMIQETKEERFHPTQKPVAVHEKVWARIEKSHKGNFSSKKVVDLFGGSGSTLIACEKTGRRAWLMELSPAYVDVILSRWAKYTGRDPVREDGMLWSEVCAILG